MINKDCNYRGQIFIEQDETKFIFYPTKFNRQLAVLYDLSYDTNEEAQLFMTTEGVQNVPQLILLKLYKKDYLLNDEEVLQIVLDTPLFFINETSVNKTLQVYSGYSLKYYAGMVEVQFTFNANTKLCLITNKHVQVHEAYKWLCGIWPPRIKCVEYYLSVNDVIVRESQTFLDYDYNDAINVQVAEKCLITPITEDDVPIILGWHKNYQILIDRLSIKLNVEKDKIKLMNKYAKYIDEKEHLDIKDFRAKGSIDVPNLYYDVLGFKVRCISMLNKDDILEIMIFNETTVSQIKKRIAFKKITNEKRLIMCKDTSLLSNTAIVQIGEELNYGIGLCNDNIVSKEEIGKGGFGKVYKCVERSSMTNFALKEFLLPSCEITKCTIIRELLVMTKLTSHNNIVKYIGIYVNDNDISIAMEFMPKGSLSAYINEFGALNENEIRKFSKDILSGLNHLHDNKTFHRDIKGENILLGINYVAKLCDFGLSKILTDFSHTELFKEWTQTAECGTYRWMAPEVIEGEKYGFMSDIWSFGATVIQMITGHVPYYEYEEIAALFRIADRKTIEFEPPNQLSKELKEFIESCIKSRPKERLTGSSLMKLSFMID